MTVVRHFDTTEIAPTGRRQAWNRTIQDLHFGMSVHLPDRSTFDGSMHYYVSDAFQLVSFSESPASFHRESSHIGADGCDDIEIIAPLEGECVVEQFGRSVIAKPGSFVMFDAAAPLTMVQARPMSALLLKARRGIFEQRLTDIEHACARSIACGEGISRLAIEFFRSVNSQITHLDAREFQSSCMQIADLMALTLQRETGIGALPVALSRDKTLARIKAYIRKNVQDHDLTTGRVAEHFGLSERYIQVLFKQANTTMRHYLREQRLFAAREQLSNPLRRGKTITQIAFESGFSSSAHFSAAFNAQFGQSPSTLRAHNDRD